MTHRTSADVCLLLEGTYPYVFGGVSSWVHDLIQAHPNLSFHLLSLVSPNSTTMERYALPDNVVGLDRVELHALPRGAVRVPKLAGLLEQFRRTMRHAEPVGFEEFAQLIRELRPLRARLGRRALLDSAAAWSMLERMYREEYTEASFIDFFWTWRALLGGLCSVLLVPMPPARVYHAVATGYSGLLAARAVVETGRPAMLTEHGIYTNERRIEIAMSDWLFERPTHGPGLGQSRRQLKDLWIGTFVGYSRICYEACSPIVTLYEGNQLLQLSDGARPETLEVIPNGIRVERYSRLAPRPGRPPTLALIGRVVPVKDVLTFIRSCAILVRSIPSLRAMVIGPVEEDPEYARECRRLVAELGLERTVTFTGKVVLDEYFPEIDVLALTSISEVQPLVVLEAGAAGIPAVVTDVGACREMIEGRPGESPALGPGGIVVPLADAEATALGVARLLGNESLRATYGAALRERVRVFYDKRSLDRSYGELYARLRSAPDREAA